MVLSNPFPGHTALTTFADLRRDLEGLVVRSAAGVMRAGVFPDHLNPLVTGRSDMKVNIADFRAVQNRGGAVLLANVGTDTSVTLPAAPAANKRIDLIYVTMRSTALADTASTPVFGFVQGTASATPVVPSLPANLTTAIPLATVEIPAGATTTLSAGVVITQVYPYTALAGGTVVVRNAVELGAWTPAPGSRAYNVADGGEYLRVGAAWSAVDPGGVTITTPDPGSITLEAGWTQITNAYWGGVKFTRVTPSLARISGAITKASSTAALAPIAKVPVLPRHPEYIPTIVGATSTYSVVMANGDLVCASAVGAGLQVSFGGEYVLAV